MVFSAKWKVIFSRVIFFLLKILYRKKLKKNYSLYLLHQLLLLFTVLKLLLESLRKSPTQLLKN